MFRVLPVLTVPHKKDMLLPIIIMMFMLFVLKEISNRSFDKKNGSDQWD